ncbi:hypothetical protein CLOP_g14918 [Closterium sp. NIES-67]|nr:hypothetical protein CLOP_g14918 [Closterium sp. NIES-67]
MHMGRLPSGFGVKITRAPYGEVDGRISPLARRYSIYFFMSASSVGLSRYGAQKIGFEPGSSTISCWCVSYGGSSFWRSLRRMSCNSFKYFLDFFFRFRGFLSVTLHLCCYRQESSVSSLDVLLESCECLHWDISCIVPVG